MRQFARLLFESKNGELYPEPAQIARVCQGNPSDITDPKRTSVLYRILTCRQNVRFLSDVNTYASVAMPNQTLVQAYQLLTFTMGWDSEATRIERLGTRRSPVVTQTVCLHSLRRTDQIQQEIAQLGKCDK